MDGGLTPHTLEETRGSQCWALSRIHASSTRDCVVLVGYADNVVMAISWVIELRP